jgi:hypothetical protein
VCLTQTDASTLGRAALRVVPLTERTVLSREEIRRAQTIASLPEETKEAARELGYDDNQSALLAAAKAATPEQQIGVLEEIAQRGSVTPVSVRPLRNLEGISGGELARWIKITPPNDRPHVIRVLEQAAAILRDELQGRTAA